MIFKIVMFPRSGNAGIDWNPHGFGLFDLFLDFADTREVFIEFVLVGATERAMQRLGIVADEIQYGFLGSEALP